MTTQQIRDYIKELIASLKRGKEGIDAIKEVFPKTVSNAFQRIDIKEGGFRVESLNADAPYVGLINEIGGSAPYNPLGSGSLPRQALRACRIPARLLVNVGYRHSLKSASPYSWADSSAG